MWIINKTRTPDFTRRKLHERVKLFSMQRKIGDFQKDFYIKQIEKIAYYHSHYKILGINHVAEIRHKSCESTPGDISTRSDYAEQFSFDPECQIQNEWFDNNRTLSMEGCCLGYFIKTVNVSIFYENDGGYVHQTNDKVREFHLYLSDSKLQNSTTTKSHLYTLLDRMRFSRSGILQY